MKKLLSALLLFLSCAAAFAETAALPPQPVEISAAKSLEWNRKARTYTARENVIVTQGEVRIQSDTLTAHYNDESGMTEISTLKADNNVTIRSGPYTAYGDHAVYDVKTGIAVLTGADLKITTAEDILTAEDKIEFFSSENRLTATGKATARHGADTLTANAISAYFTKETGGKMTVSRIAGAGGVTIKTPKETATGDSGVYNVPEKKAVLTGKVRVFQGENWLEGTRADVDMVTGISRLSGMGNTETEGRVKGVFYPKSGKN